MAVLDSIDSESALLLPAYIDKWQNLTLSTQPIDLVQAKTAVENAYIEIEQEKPAVLLFPSPFAVLPFLIDLQLSGQCVQPLTFLTTLYFDPYFKEMFKVHYLIRQTELYAQYFWWELIRSNLNHIYHHQLRRKINTQFQGDHMLIQQHVGLLREELFPLNCYGNYCSGKIELWSGAIDFCITVLGHGNSQQWQLIESLIQSCGWIFPYSGLALVCARPTKVSVDMYGSLHAESEPALQYADGYSFYAFHGRIVSPQQLIYLVEAEQNGRLDQVTWELALSPSSRRKLKNLAISYLPW
jgi:hypothetical protein